MKWSGEIGFWTLVLLSQLLWIFFDIDLGDQAYHSVSSWLMAFHSHQPFVVLPLWFEQVPVWFSYFVDSIWWKLIGPFAVVLWTRIGWVIFQVMVLVGLRLSLAAVYSGESTKWPLFLGLLAVNSAADQFVLSYYVVPPALGAISFAFLAAGLRSTLKQRAAFLVLSGFTTSLVMHSRMPTGPFVLAAFFLGFVGVWAVARPAGLGRVIGLWLIGFIFGHVAAFGALECIGQREYLMPGLSGFLDGVASSANQRYSSAIVWRRALGHYGKFILGGAVFLMFVWIFNWAGYRRRNLLVFAITAIVAGFSFIKYGVVLSLVVGGSLLLLLVRMFLGGASSGILVLGSVSCLVFFTLGTFLEGVQIFKYGLWLLVPVALIEAGKIPGVFWSKSGRMILVVSVLVLYSVTRVFWPTFPYRERPIYRMTAPLVGAGLWTYPEKASLLNGLTDELRRRGLKSGDQLLAYSGVPPFYPISGIYLLTRTVPLLLDPGFVEYPGARWPKHLSEMTRLKEFGNLPRFVVRQSREIPRSGSGVGAAIKFTVTKDWPRSLPPLWPPLDAIGLAKEMDNFLVAAGYKVVWMNEIFVILDRFNLASVERL